MAKMKTWAVEVTVTETRTVFVEARRERGALEKVATAEGWLDANRYQEDIDWPRYPDSRVSIGAAKVADL